MAGVRWLIGELDVAYSSPEEFGQIALAWLTEGVQAQAGISARRSWRPRR
jgi:hypothetical protein